MLLLGDVGHVESYFGPFRDCVISVRLETLDTCTVRA
jgi:hypothetical protein